MSEMKPDSPLTGSTRRLIEQTEGWTPEQYCAKWAALERELATLRERLAEREAELGRYMMANNTLGEKLVEADSIRKIDCALVTEYQKRAQQAEQRAEQNAKDAERMKWKYRQYALTCEATGLGGVMSYESWIAAIDAARSAT